MSTVKDLKVGDMFRWIGGCVDNTVLFVGDRILVYRAETLDGHEYTKPIDSITGVTIVTPPKYRPFTMNEAPALIGKVLFCDIDNRLCLVDRIDTEDEDDTVHAEGLGWHSLNYLFNNYQIATIAEDGSYTLRLCGVLE